MKREIRVVETRDRKAFEKEVAELLNKDFYLAGSMSTAMNSLDIVYYSQMLVRDIRR